MNEPFTLSEVFGTAATEIVGQASEVVSTVLPTGLTLVAIVIAVSFGMKFIRKVTKG